MSTPALTTTICPICKNSTRLMAPSGYCFPCDYDMKHHTGEWAEGGSMYVAEVNTGNIQEEKIPESASATEVTSDTPHKVGIRVAVRSFMDSTNGRPVTPSEVEDAVRDQVESTNLKSSIRAIMSSLYHAWGNGTYSTQPFTTPEKSEDAVMFEPVASQQEQEQESVKEDEMVAPLHREPEFREMTGGYILPTSAQRALVLALSTASFQIANQAQNPEMRQFFHGYLCGMEQAIAVLCGTLGYSVEFLEEKNREDTAE